VYFLKRYLATHRIIEWSHIWQTITPKVPVENVEDEECYNFILLKFPTLIKILNFMLFNNLFFMSGLAFFSKGVWQPCGCQHSCSQRQKVFYGFRNKWLVRH